MKVYARFLTLASGLLLLANPGLSAGKLYTLEEYLKSVKAANQTIQIASTTIAAGELRTDATDIMFSPQFFTQASHTHDAREQANPTSPERIDATNITFGIQKLWENGLQSQISHSTTRVQLDQAEIPATYQIDFPFPNPAAPGTSTIVPVTIANPVLGVLPRDDYTEARTQLDLVQPLLKNSGGSDHKLTRELARTKIQMQKLGESYKVKNLLAQAENIYWQLALAQEAVRNQEGTIERFRKIRAWAANRAQSQLGDRIDLLQAEAGLKAKIFELEGMKRDRNALQRVFNSLRGFNGEAVSEQLTPLAKKTLVNTSLNVQKGTSEVKRLDIEIAKKAERLAEIEIEQSREKYKSQLDVFGTFALQDIDEKGYNALVGSASSTHPLVTVGVKFSTPLDEHIINRDREGLVQSSKATRLDRELKEFNARQDWLDLRAQLREAEQRLILANELEAAQKEKLSYERIRLENGRTTTYQILNFENDYAQSQLATIRSKAEILGILAKLKSFGDAV